ncbi:2-amino-5-chloromuconic acid deaminase [Polaromonas vacuolata]|uniref:2-amino-5-chloromuconic acid deaminase n=1 Tax=Polaromonas vacuolata TaxID=37448 RepID=A0A6H2HBD4_9BURK|nr:amidase [Polaromonas vacuolata]QJC56904.1 2-amino-5-chloromuconic acid deaminase [Polaromonas vacuolata]
MNQAQTNPAAKPLHTLDIYAARTQLQAGRLSQDEIMQSAAGIVASTACDHVFIPNAAPSYQVNPRLQQLPLAGLPISIKDLFDVAGQVTTAGSTVLSDKPAASKDCPAVARLRAAGALLAGRTNMVEFAFSGIGLNPHFGTPVNPADPHVARIPGGSSSGAAVSVASGAAFAALGSDTGGSLRIPAALCGLVGFKSTARLVPTHGAVPLSSSMDTVGAITRSVRDSITLHQILAAQDLKPNAKPLSQCRFAIASCLMQDALDPTVAAGFERGLRLLRQAGAQIEEVAMKELSELAGINASGGLSAAESYAWHRQLIAARQAEYDPRVSIRILRGASMSAADYIDLLNARKDWIARMQTGMAGFDAVISPTVAVVAPSIASVQHDDAEFFRVNSLMLRNTSAVNMLDGCAISLPCHNAEQLPVGLMLWHGALRDDALLSIALQVEAALVPAS